MVAHNEESSMAAKIESSSASSNKVSTSDRLARKRAAARLRQQRCRARKRQVMLERRRSEDGSGLFGSQDSTVKSIDVEMKRSIPPFSVSTVKQAPSSSPNGPIYNCVSFDSSRSSEDTPPSSQSVPLITSGNASDQSSTSTPTVSAQTTKPIEAVNIAKSQPEDPLVAEEEAAIAAMLSLKSLGATGTPTPSTPVMPKHSSHRKVTKPSPNPSKYRRYGEWDCYDPYSYGRHGYGPTYYNMGMSHRAPPPQYRYYPPYPKVYSRFEYE